MARYRRLPDECEAVQWFPDVAVDGVAWEQTSQDAGRLGLFVKDLFHDGRVFTPYAFTALGKKAYVYPGDWILSEPEGGPVIRVMRRAEFEKRWVLIEEATQKEGDSA